MTRAAAFAAVAATVCLAGCGRPRASRDVGAFTRQGATPTEQAILRSIGLYRTAAGRLACTLITPHFLKARYDGQLHGCEVIAGEAPRTLPRSAHVESVTGERAGVRIHELTATVSIYRMRRLAGTWKIDDIVEAK